VVTWSEGLDDGVAGDTTKSLLLQRIKSLFLSTMRIPNAVQ